MQADFATPVTYTTGGGAIISTRDAVSFSFGLEQVDQATRNELVRRTMSYLLPTAADTTAPTIVGFKYPPNLSTGTPRDPVDIELTAFDERGDMDYVDLKVGDQLIQRTEVYPFQFRYTPPASAVGSVVTLTAEAVDSAGNKSTRDLLINVLAGDTPPGTPVAVAPADAARHADRRLAAVLPQRRVPQPAQDADLRLAAQRRRHRRRHHADVHAHRRRPRPLGRLPHHGDQRRAAPAKRRRTR